MIRVSCSNPSCIPRTLELSCFPYPTPVPFHFSRAAFILQAIIVGRIDVPAFASHEGDVVVTLARVLTFLLTPLAGAVNSTADV